MSFLRHIIWKSIENFFQVVFNIKMLIALIISFFIEWILVVKNNDFPKIILVGIIAGVLSMWMFNKMVEIIREADGKKHNNNGVLLNSFRILWNSILVGVVVVIIGLITYTVAGSASHTNNKLEIAFFGVGVLVYLWYTTKIVFFPYSIVSDGLDNPISISLELTENKFFKVLTLNIMCHLILYFEIKMFGGGNNLVLLMIQAGIISLTTLFIMILYYNGYERLKEFQLAK